MTAQSAGRITFAFLAAVLVTTVIGSIVQTQFNLARIVRMGAEVTGEVRLTTTLQDVLGFGPVMAAIATTAFLPAFAAAFLAVRLLPIPAGPVYAAAGMAGLLAAFWLMGFFTPMPTLVAAVRGLDGLLAVSAAGLAGGLVFVTLGRRKVA